DDAGPYNESSPMNTGVTYGSNDAVLVMTSWTGSSATNRVTFRPAPGERPVLDATGRAMGVFWGGADFVTLQGLEVCNATYDGISLFAETGNGVANDPIIDSCRVHDCGSAGITIYGNAPNPTNTLVQNCTLWSCQKNNSGAFTTTSRFGYITTRRTINTRIVHNTFFVDTGTGSDFCVIGSRTSSGTEMPYAEISNNVIFKLAAAGRPIFRFHTPTTSTFPIPPLCNGNCYFDATSSPFAEFGPGAGTTAATFAAWQQTGADATSLAADPQLRDVNSDDFHLQASSPCRDASTVAAGVAADADGQPRPSPEDLGADEYSAGDFSLVGVGCPGTGGNVTTLDLWTWPFLGNPAFAIGFDDAPASAIVGLFGSLGLAPAPIAIGGGCDAFLDPGSLVALGASVTNPVGETSVFFPLPANATFAGFRIGYQGIVLDAGVPLGFSVTNAIDTTFDF
ncbi:MAG: right-handed parallel beta-helix repeat-containing protein, partial [Planctomycetes bacterium]|nr:right-handed parallel beta-helix repeat-containing protein [Planctomycetota bacterium]